MKPALSEAAHYLRIGKIAFEKRAVLECNAAEIAVPEVAFFENAAIIWISGLKRGELPELNYLSVHPASIH